MMRSGRPSGWSSAALVVAVLLFSAGINPATVGRVCAMLSLQYLAGLAVIRLIGARDVSQHGIGTPFMIGAAASVVTRQVALALGVWDPSIIVIGGLATVGLFGGGDSRRREVEAPQPIALLLATSAALVHDMHWTVVLLTVSCALSVRLRSRSVSRSRLLTGITVACGVVISRTAVAHDQWLSHRTDYLFFDGLARGIDRFGIWDNPFAAGTRLSYHILTYGWLGQLERISGTERWVAVSIVGPVVLGVLLLSQLWTLCCRLGMKQPIVVVAISAMMSSIAGWSVGLHILRLESLSSLLGGIGILAVATLAPPLLPLTGKTAVLTAVLTTLTTAAKISHGILAGVMLCAGHLSARGLPWPKRLMYSAIGPAAAAAGVSIAMPPWVSTADRTMAITPLAFTWQIRPETVGAPTITYAATAALLALSLGAPVFVALMTRISTESGPHRGMNAAITTGLVAFLVTGSCCMGQGYFLQAALLLASIPVVGVLSESSNRAALVWCSVGAGLQALLFSAPVLFPDLLNGFRASMTPHLVALPVAAGVGVWFLIPRWRHNTARALAALTVGIGIAASIWNLAASTDARSIFSRDEITPLEVVSDPERDLVQWSRTATTRDEIFASNYGLCEPSNCTMLAEKGSAILACRANRSEGVSRCWFGVGTPQVSILDRRFYVTHFSWLSRGAPPEPIVRRISETVRLALTATVDTAAPLREAGVTWFIVDKDLPHADDYGAVGTVRYENSRFIVLELHDA